MSEHDQQVIVVDYLRARGIPFFSVPNGAVLGGRNKFALLNKLKAEGFTNGAPDLVLITNPVVIIEMKDIGGKEPTADQERIHEHARTAGWIVIVAYGADEAIEKLQEIGV